MATIKKGPLGDIKGKIGNLVARTLNGKTVVSVRPLKYKKTKSKKAALARNKFKVAVKFCKYLNSIQLLKLIWRQIFPRCSNVFNKMESFNISTSGKRTPTLQNIITPPPQSNKFLIEPLINEINFNGGSITGKFINIDRRNLPSRNYEYYLIFVILYYKPKIKKHVYFDIEHFIVPADILSNKKKFILKNAGINKDIFKNIIIYSAAAAFDKKNNKYYCSFTSAVGFDLIK